MTMQMGAVWLLRAIWFLLPLTVGPVAGDAIASADHAVPQVLTVGLWILWSAGMVASMVLSPISLTTLRVMAPAVVVLAVWALADTDFAGLAIVAVVHAVALTVVTLNQLIGDQYSDGASYGDERRMLLRPPVQLGFVVAPAVWALMVAGIAAGPLLLGNRSWLVGAILTVVGFGAAGAGSRSLHQLTQRWIIFVPTGIVLHDLMMLTEPVLFRRTAIERLGPAIEGTPARDLSNNAAGLLLECELTDPAPLGLRDAGANTSGGASLVDVRRFLISPTRPGALLAEADRRNIPVG